MSSSDLWHLFAGVASVVLSFVGGGVLHKMNAFNDRLETLGERVSRVEGRMNGH